MIPFYKIPKMPNHNTNLSDCYADHTLSTRLKEQMVGVCKNKLSAHQIFLTHSATAALELMALGMAIKTGDEVILPSFTYAATANAFAKLGARLRFVDIEPKTLNIDPDEVAKVVSKKTKAIIPIHYGGIAADMSKLKKVINGTQALLLEDASHCIGASYEGAPLGTIGDMGCLSFHYTKNITSAGSGGCLFVNSDEVELLKTVDEALYQGTNRSAFTRGEVPRYEWQRMGGAYDMPLMNQQYLSGQLAELELITDKRKLLWHRYQDALRPLEEKGYIHLAQLPENCEHNGHIFYLYTSILADRDALIKVLYENEIQAFSHYEPLHLTSIGIRVSQEKNKLRNTEYIALSLVRLPVYFDMTLEEQDRVIGIIVKYFSQK